MAALTVDSENTVDQHQQMTWQPKSSRLWKLHTGLQATWILCLSTLLQTLGPWFPNEMQNLLSSEKRTLDHWATVQFFFSTAQVRCFWRCLCSEVLVALFLKMSEHGDSWCTDSSFSPLLVKLSQVFESALLDCILKLAVIPVACAPFLPKFFLPVNFALNMLWYWSSGSLPIQQSSPYCGFKDKRYPELYCMDGH